MRVIATFLIMMVLTIKSTAQIITFDDQGYALGQILTNPISITNNGETFLFTISGGGATNHIYRTSEPSCGSTGISHIYAGNTTQTTWEIETTSGNEINLGTINFDNVFSCFSFNYSLTIEGFKNTVSTGAQIFSVNGLNNTFTSNANFDDVDKIVITSTDLAHLGIDDINWTMSTLHNEEFALDDAINLEIDLSSNFIRIKSSSQVEFKNYTIYSISGAKIKEGVNTEISTASLTSSIYILKLDFDKGTVVKKIIIN